MTLQSAVTIFQDTAEQIKPDKEPEKWALYAGLADLAQGLDQEIRKLEQQISRLEQR